MMFSVWISNLNIKPTLMNLTNGERDQKVVLNDSIIAWNSQYVEFVECSVGGRQCVEKWLTWTLCSECHLFPGYVPPPPSWWLASGTLAVERRRTSHTQLQFNCGLDIDRTFTFTSCRHLAPCRSEVTHKVTQMRLTEHSEKQSSVIRVRWRVDLSSPWNCLSYFESGF